MRACLLSLLTLWGCTVSVPLEGKRCATTEPRCVPGWACVDGLCVRDAGDGAAACPLELDPARRLSGCSERTWYLAADGDDGRDGRTAATARRSLPAAGTVKAGDEVVLLPGDYATPPALSLNGNAGCPILYRGDADGGTVLHAQLELSGSYAVLRDVVFRVAAADALQVVEPSHHLVLQRATFAPEPTAASWFHSVHFVAPCTDCVVRESRFRGIDRIGLVYVRGANFVFRGNQVTCGPGAGLDLTGPGAVVEGNEFVGAFNQTGYVNLGPSGRFEFNVVTVEGDNPDKVFVVGDDGGVVRRNTFQLTNLPLGAVADEVDFSNNLVSAGVREVVRAPRWLGDFNLVEDGVAWWLDSDGGVVAPHNLRGPLLLGVDSVPLESCLALDAADPQLPVPPGGGARADIGARERGATLLSDGRYCLVDGGS